jgi:hypothetical protein
MGEAGLSTARSEVPRYQRCDKTVSRENREVREYCCSIF